MTYEISSERRDIENQMCEISERALSVLQDVLRTTQQRNSISSLTGIPAMTLKDYYTGRTSPPLERFIMIALASGLSPVDFFEPKGAPTLMLPAPPLDPIDVIRVPHLDVEAAAGDGTFVDVVVAETSFPFPILFLEKLLGAAAQSARLETLRARGSSMSPTIADGALLMIDRAQSILPPVPKRGHKICLDIYVFIQRGDVRLKRLQRIRDDLIVILSDNRDEFPPEVFDLKRDGSFKVIGKVVWWDNRL